MKPTAEGGINANMKTVMTDPKYKEPCVAILPGEIVSVATTGIGGFGGWVVIKLYAHDYKSSPTGDKRVRDASGKIRTLYQICGHIESIPDNIKRGAVVARGPVHLQRALALDIVAMILVEILHLVVEEDAAEHVLRDRDRLVLLRLVLPVHILTSHWHQWK